MVGPRKRLTPTPEQAHQGEMRSFLDLSHLELHGLEPALGNLPRNQWAASEAAVTGSLCDPYGQFIILSTGYVSCSELKAGDVDVLLPP